MAVDTMGGVEEDEEAGTRSKRRYIFDTYPHKVTRTCGMHPLQSYKEDEEGRPSILPLSSRRLSPPTFLCKTLSKNTCPMLLALVRRASVAAGSFFAFFSFFSWSHQRLRRKTGSRRLRMSFGFIAMLLILQFIYVYIYWY